MNYCTRCVQPDTRPGIRFNADGVCPACQYTEPFGSIDWAARQRELQQIIERSKKDNHSDYDCIVGVSGGKDSTRQALYVRDTLGLRALLVSCTYPPEQTAERGPQNLSNLIALGFDTLTVGPDPQTWKALMRRGFLEYGNWCKSTETALYATLPRVSIAYHIPLIFLGENPATQLGDLDVGSLTWDANGTKNQNTLAQGADIFLDHVPTPQHLICYRHPSNEEFDLAHVQMVFLGYFWRNFTKVDNADFSMAYGLDVRTDNPEDRGALHPYEALDEDFVFVNQMIKYFKYGFGKVTDEVCELIRYGRLTRDEGLDLVRRFDGTCAPEYIRRFCEYLEIGEHEFWRVANSYRNPKIFSQDPDGSWHFRPA